MVRTEHVRTVADSTQSKQSKIDVRGNEYGNAFQYTFRQSPLSQLSVVGSEHVMTAFDATQAIKISKSQFDRSAVTPASSVQRLDSP